MSTCPLLEVRNLCVDVAGRPVLRGVDLAIARGAILGLCGASGCGKTTLALALTGLLDSYQYAVRGEVLLEGRDLLSLTEAELERVRGARIAYIFQDAWLALNPVLRVRTQIAEVPRAHGMDCNPDALLRMAGLPEPARFGGAYPHQLSGGEQQRVAIAQALSCSPQLIVADEPFTALDPPRTLELIGLFRRLRDETGASLLVISHSPGVLKALADEVVRL